jgi:hypothetical protein
LNAKVIVGIIIGVITITSIVFALSYTSTEEATGVEDNSEISDSLETITDSEAEEEEHITLELSDDVATTTKP